IPPATRRELIIKFFDYLEANGEDYWQVPALDLVRGGDEVEEDADDLYSAAYDEVTYQDSTGDDEGAVSDGGGPPEEFDLEQEGERVEKRLRFLSTLARLWQVAARYAAAGRGGEPAPAHPIGTALPAWLAEARTNHRRPLERLGATHPHPLPDPTGDYDPPVEFHRPRPAKDQP